MFVLFQIQNNNINSVFELTEVSKKEIITLAEVKKILESVPIDEMDQIACERIGPCPT